MADPSSDAAAFNPLRMGLEPRDLDEWLKPRAGDTTVLAERAALIAQKPADVIAVSPESHHALVELAALLAQRGVEGVPSSGDAFTLAAVGRALAEDICVLTARNGAYHLTAAVLCFPNRWRLADKIGRGLLDIHGPVPDYPEALASAVDRFLERLRPMRFYMRENWGVASQPDRHLPNPIPPVDLAGAPPFFARTEEQGFLKLPETGAVIFSIRTIIVPWVEAPESRRAGIMAAAGSLSAPWLAYKSIVRR